MSLQNPTIDKVMGFLNSVTFLKLVYFITSNLGISPSRCMVLRILTAPVTVCLSISCPFSPLSGRKK